MGGVLGVENDVCEPKSVVVVEELEAEIRAQDATIVRLVSENYELRQALKARG